MFKKKNTPLVLGLLIPVALIVFVAASIYLPGLFIKPKYNFLYYTNRDYYSRYIYVVRNGRLTMASNAVSQYGSVNRQASDPKLYIHDAATNKSLPISFNEAANLVLDPNLQSPDGYSLENGDQGGGLFSLLLFSADYDRNETYLVGHNISKKLNVKRESASYTSSYYNKIQFLGWIIK